MVAEMGTVINGRRQIFAQLFRTVVGYALRLLGQELKKKKRTPPVSPPFDLANHVVCTTCPKKM